MTMTCEEATRFALARAYEVTSEVPATRSLCYRQLGLRQQQLLSAAGRANPEFYGASASADLDAGVADFADIDPANVPQPAFIQLVTISNPGTSLWRAGTIVSIVPIVDWTAGIAPRATLRDLVLRQVAADLDGVQTITMYYTRLAPAYDHDDADTPLELESPWDDVLVIDLAKALLTKSPAATSAAVVSLLQAMAAEETSKVEAFLNYVRDFTPIEARFGVSI